MSSTRIPDEHEKAIMIRNGLDPQEYGVIKSTDDEMQLLRYSTRDYIFIYRGDKKW